MRALAWFSFLFVLPSALTLAQPVLPENIIRDVGRILERADEDPQGAIDALEHHGSPEQQAGVVLSQALLLGLAGALAGIAIGLLVGWVLVAVVNVQSFGWTLRFLPPWGTLLVTAGLVLPACLLAGLAPALASLSRPPQEGLRVVV